MHDHDLDLIASLADGSLDDPAEARALVETCQDCSLEYETQLAIIASLSTIEPVTMTELEKAALHRDLWSELRSQSARKPATPWWYRFSYAAAGLFVVVGLVAVATQMGGIGGDSQSATTVADATAFEEDASGDVQSPLSEDGSEEATESTMAAADAGAESTADFEALATETRLQQLPPTSRATQMTEEQVDCLKAAGLEDQELAGTVERDRTYLIAVPTGVDLDADTPVTFVDVDTCEVAHVEE